MQLFEYHKNKHQENNYILPAFLDMLEKCNANTRKIQY